MAIQEIENYQALQDQYEGQLAAYQKRDAEYRAALAANTDPSRKAELNKQFEELEATRIELDGLYKRVSEIRNGLAHARQDALNRIAF